ncbi:MAG: hypothetical protein II388_12610 [Clostridia bacterium]|nr:hypothetical protein [Clostridia bacterium]
MLCDELFERYNALSAATYKSSNVFPFSGAAATPQHDFRLNLVGLS